MSDGEPRESLPERGTRAYRDEIVTRALWDIDRYVLRDDEGRHLPRTGTLRMHPETWLRLMVATSPVLWVGRVAASPEHQLFGVHVEYDRGLELGAVTYTLERACRIDVEGL